MVRTKNETPGRNHSTPSPGRSMPVRTAGLLSLAGVMMVVAGCSGSHAGAAHAATASPAGQQAKPATCGAQAGASKNQRSLSPQQIGARKGAKSARTVASMVLKTSACGKRNATAKIPVDQCDLQDFPWAGDGESTTTTTYNYGIDSLTSASYTINGKAALREFVVDVHDTDYAEKFAKHLVACDDDTEAADSSEAPDSGETTDSSEAKSDKDSEALPDRFTTKNGAMEVSGTTIVVLVSADGRDVAPLLNKAVHQATR